MKQLILLRHAKAVTKAAVQDFDRVLAPEGRREMERIAANLRASSIAPDLALVSPAARTRETWALTRIGGGAPRFEQSIYDAEVETLMELVRAVPDDIGRLMLVGHNPGIEELALLVGGEGAKPSIGGGLPTAALAVFDLPEGRWADLAAGTGSLVHFAIPASLASPDG